MLPIATRRPMTLTQKILAHHAKGLVRPYVQAGDILQIAVDWTIASELAWNGMERTYQALGRPRARGPADGLARCRGRRARGSGRRGWARVDMMQDVIQVEVVHNLN